MQGVGLYHRATHAHDRCGGRALCLCRRAGASWRPHLVSPTRADCSPCSACGASSVVRSCVLSVSVSPHPPEPPIPPSRARSRDLLSTTCWLSTYSAPCCRLFLVSYPCHLLRVIHVFLPSILAWLSTTRHSTCDARARRKVPKQLASAPLRSRHGSLALVFAAGHERVRVWGVGFGVGWWGRWGQHGGERRESFV